MISVILSGADVSNGEGDPMAGSFFRGADLTFADLSYANLENASGINEKSLEQQDVILTGTIMPDGTKHPYNKDPYDPP
jgi:uncharacterized protein YjbI with pentapeptide repeats